ncbi:MAG: DUF4911 domain-containing protein [Flexistipes sinusarabici]|uniref:DUF4911 domain-containing protein n=1 Tax=Flexistipes sinusarabici TaxID=2352 RepID=A0A5D0MIK4_FLESI|nr:MAG: DUF4911 domain-containing protein [Flexistipes sinusarabici]
MSSLYDRVSSLNSKCIKIKFITDINDVLYINSIIDSYEGVGIVRTIDSAKGKVVIFTSSGMCKYALNVLKSLKDEGLNIKNIIVEENEEVDSF